MYSPEVFFRFVLIHFRSSGRTKAGIGYMIIQHEKNTSGVIAICIALTSLIWSWEQTGQQFKETTTKAI